MLTILAIRVQLASAGVVTLLLIAPLHARQSNGPSDLCGAWVLHQDESDGNASGGDGGALLYDAIRSREMIRTQGLIRELLALEEWFAISVADDGGVAYVLRDGRTVRFAASGMREQHEFTVGTVQTTTRWVHDTLVREITSPDGSTLTETYTLLRAPRRLRIDLRVANWRLTAPLKMTRIYDDARTR